MNILSLPIFAVFNFIEEVWKHEFRFILLFFIVRETFQLFLKSRRRASEEDANSGIWQVKTVDVVADET